MFRQVVMELAAGSRRIVGDFRGNVSPQSGGFRDMQSGMCTWGFGLIWTSEIPDERQMSDRSGGTKSWRRVVLAMLDAGNSAIYSAVRNSPL